MFSFYSALNDVYFAVWVSPVVQSSSPVVQSSDCTHPVSYYIQAKLQYGPTGRTTTEGSSMSVSGMGCWNTAPGTGQQLGEANFDTLNAY